MHTGSGYTLIELMVGMAITAALIGVIVTAIMQFTTVGHEGTAKLVRFDKLQLVSRWFVRDAQNSFLVGTPVNCTANCGSISFSFCDLSQDPSFHYESPVAPQIYGTFTCINTGTITYYTEDNDLFRHDEVKDEITLIVEDVDVGFSHDVYTGTRNRRMAVMDISIPSGSPRVAMTYHAYLRAMEGE